GFSAAADDPEHAYEWANNDIDLGGGGVTVIPGTSQLVGGGKTGVLYLLDTTTMMSLQTPPLKAFENTYNPCDPECKRYGGKPGRGDKWSIGPHLHGAPTYWQLSPDKGLVFHWSEKDYVKRFDHDRLSTPPMLNLTQRGDVRGEGGDYTDPKADNPW